jgi:hypothetical protein
MVSVLMGHGVSLRFMERVKLEELRPVVRYQKWVSGLFK